MVTLLLARNTLDGCQATNTHTDCYLDCYYLFGCLFVFFIIVCSVAFFTFYITFMLFAFSYPIIFCAYRLSTSTGVPSLVSNFPKTYARTCFELIVSFGLSKLTSDLFLLVNNIHNWRILRLY